MHMNADATRTDRNKVPCHKYRVCLFLRFPNYHMTVDALQLSHACLSNDAERLYSTEEEESIFRFQWQRHTIFLGSNSRRMDSFPRFPSMLHDGTGCAVAPFSTLRPAVF